MNQSNGNTQINTERIQHNNRVNRLTNVGKSKRITWSAKRRFRTI